ncbi:MAG: prepilin-type N-terminal cleavage/methylation domain-containing protein [Elusimicrobia bacterium]|nr:prepilin-type N-terminal cleavage/methylation domain-containing protein [Elusimicrobiota bacterium]
MGFTLIEVLVAIVITTIAMAGLMSVFLVSAQHTGRTTNQVSASYYQKRILEELKTYVVDAPWDHCIVGPNCDDLDFGEIHHADAVCACSPNACASVGGFHYMLEDSDAGAGAATTHQAIRPDGSHMLTLTDDLRAKYNAPTPTYTVDDDLVGGKQIQANVTWTEPTL